MSGMFYLLSDDTPPCSPRAAGGSTEIDYAAVFKSWCDNDPILAGMHDGTLSWADVADLEDAEWAARGGRPVVLEPGFQVVTARYRAPRPPLVPKAACGGGHVNLVDLALREQVGGLGREMVRREDEIATAETRSRCSSVASEPEECRFYNSPKGCRNGDDCPYEHVKRSLCEIRCRFLDTDRGCRPSRGVRCPYKH